MSKAGVPKLSLRMYPFSIAIDGPPKISYDKKAEKNKYTC